MLLERRHDDPDFDPFLPQIGCGICGRAVQTVTNEITAELYRQAYQAPPEDQVAAQLRQAFEATMARWSQAHSEQHSAEEHAAHEAGLRAG